MKKDNFSIEKLSKDWLKDFEQLPSLQDEAIRKAAAEVEDQKRGIILAKLQEKGIELDIAKESVARFKSLSVTYRDNEETIYFNDGSPNGLRIVTFKTVIEPIKQHERSASITANTTYY